MNERCSNIIAAGLCLTYGYVNPFIFLFCLLFRNLSMFTIFRIFILNILLAFKHLHYCTLLCVNKGRSVCVLAELYSFNMCLCIRLV